MKKLLFTALILLFVFACTDKFSDPTIFESNNDNSNFGDTVYIQQFPIWDGFNKPQDMIIGRETFIYVADTENDRIVMMNVAGQILGYKEIPKPIAIAQDHRLNLIVCGELYDESSGNTYSAVYKMNLVEAQHIIANAKVDTILPATAFDFSRPDRKYTGITVFSDNSYYIARTGPVNSSPIDPDNSLLIFQVKKLNNGAPKDTLLGRVPQVSPNGTGLVSANQLTSVKSFNKNSLDIVVALKGENSFKVQWLQWVETVLFTGYVSKLQAFSSDLMTVGKFDQPEGVAIDEADNIYVADAAKDSVYKFNFAGDLLQGFGGNEVFDSPHAVAYYDRTLYVVDTNNDRILRYILSTELD